MSEIENHHRLRTHAELNRPMRASLRIGVGDRRLQADAEITPAGILAIGGMVALILAAVVPIIKAGRE